MADVISNWWGLVGFVTTLLPVLDYLLPEKVQKRAERVLHLASANRRLAMVVLGAAGLLVAAFQAYDGASEKARAAQAELAQAKAELAQMKLGEARRFQSSEAARRQTIVNGQLTKFLSQALDLWSADVTREQFPRWARLQEAFVAEASKWVEENLGVAAKDKLLTKAPFPKISAFRLVDPSQRDRLELLDSIAGNLADLMRDVALGSAAPKPTAFPSPRSPP